jgi:hypothetical protein
VCALLVLLLPTTTNRLARQTATAIGVAIVVAIAVRPHHN